MAKTLLFNLMDVTRCQKKLISFRGDFHPISSRPCRAYTRQIQSTQKDYSVSCFRINVPLSSPWGLTMEMIYIKYKLHRAQEALEEAMVLAKEKR